jgi:hypothetical protein
MAERSIRADRWEHRTKIVATTRLGGSGYYDTATEVWRARLATDLAAFLERTPPEGGLMHVTLSWMAHDDREPATPRDDD